MRSLPLLLILLVVLPAVWAQEKPDAPKPHVRPGVDKVDCRELHGRDLDECLQKKYPDLWGLEKPVNSLGEAFKTGAMPYFVSGYVAATILDEEGTQHCISEGHCQEGNRLLGQNRAQAYAVGSFLAAATVFTALELRKHGHGSLAVFLLSGGIAVHGVFALDGWRQ